MTERVLQKEDRISVAELTERMMKEYDMKREEAAREIYKMWQVGKIELTDNSPPKSIFSYFSSVYASWFWALAAVSLITLLSIFVIPQYAPFIYIRYVSGALYSKAEELDQLERLALSIGLSLAVVPLLGLVLNYTPWGIRLVPIIISLIVFTFAMALIAAKRKLEYIKLAYSS